MCLYIYKEVQFYLTVPMWLRTKCAAVIAWERVATVRLATLS